DFKITLVYGQFFYALESMYFIIRFHFTYFSYFCTQMRIIPALLLLFSSLNLKAQDTESHYRGLQFNVFPGFLIGHREYVANMEAHSVGFEVIYSSDATGWKTCEEQYKNLRWATGITYFGIGNRELNGRVYAWHIHVEANLKKREKFQSTLRFGSGI